MSAQSIGASQNVHSGESPFGTTGSVRAGDRVLPSSSSRRWEDPAVVFDLVDVSVPEVHRLVHTRPQPDCDLCPATACPCGAVSCLDAFDHRRRYVAAETTWRRAVSA